MVKTASYAGDPENGLAIDYVAGNTSRTRPENRLQYPALDGLRAIALAMVIAWHYLAVPWGWAGVDVFFVLSGFLITGILMDTRDDRHRVRNFYLRRTLRIFPLYYGVLLLMLALTPVFHWQWSAAWAAWPLYVGNLLVLLRGPVHSPTWDATVGLLHGSFAGHEVTARLGHFWSLCVEEQFYLVWPWIVFRLKNRRQLWWFCVAALVVCALLRLFISYRFPAMAESVAHLTFTRADSLLAGAMIAIALRGPQAERWLAIGRRLWTPAFAAFCLWAFVLPPRLFRWHLYPMPLWTETWGYVLLYALSALLLLNLVEGSSRWCSVCRWQPLRWVGRLTYGMYVFHDIPHGLYERMTPHGLGVTVASVMTAGIAVVCTVALAWVSFRFVEKPLLDLKERYTVRG